MQLQEQPVHHAATDHFWFYPSIIKCQEERSICLKQDD